jgi:hypothetical protein
MTSKFQTKVIKEMEAKGYLVLKLIRMNKAGYPDLLCIKENEPNIWVECKETKDSLKNLQKLRIDQLNEIGNVAYCLQDTKGKIYPNKNENETLNF